MEAVSLKLKLLELQEQLARKEKECEQLRQQLVLEKFGIERFSTDNKLIKFYTGFKDYEVLYTFYSYIYNSANTMKSMYYYDATEIPSQAGRPRNMLLIDEFFYVFV